MRGKSASKASKKRWNPSVSDHCKGSWDAMEKAMPTCDIQRVVDREGRDEVEKEYTVSFRRSFAYVFCAIVYPCGIAVYGDFFGDSESPT